MLAAVLIATDLLFTAYHILCQPPEQSFQTHIFSPHRNQIFSRHSNLGSDGKLSRCRWWPEKVKTTLRWRELWWGKTTISCSLRCSWLSMTRARGGDVWGEVYGICGDWDPGVRLHPGHHYHAIRTLFTIFLLFQPHAFLAIITRQLSTMLHLRFLSTHLFFWISPLDRILGINILRCVSQTRGFLPRSDACCHKYCIEV